MYHLVVEQEGASDSGKSLGDDVRARGNERDLAKSLSLMCNGKTPWDIEGKGATTPRLWGVRFPRCAAPDPCVVSFETNTRLEPWRTRTVKDLFNGVGAVTLFESPGSLFFFASLA